MSILARLNLVQQSTRFKWVASGLVLFLWAILVGTLWVSANQPGAAPGAGTPGNQGEITAPGVGPWAAFVDAGPITLVRHGVDAARGAMRQASGTAMVVGITLAAAIGLVFVIWLGLGLSYLALFLLGWGIAWPLAAWPASAQIGRLLLGVVPLTLFFLVLMQVLRLALGASIPLVAVARNVLSEAVRMKVSLVFIVILIIFLALVPGMLTEDQPLRYRVQQWLSYGVGISYTVLAMLTLFLSAATVAFEQRDRVIWQTMTKPVPHWQYLAGKWVGVMGLNAVLLTVTAAGVYLFTEYLSHQRAVGETAYFVRNDGARADPDSEFVAEAVKGRIEEIKQASPGWQETPVRLAALRQQISAEMMSEDRRLLQLQVLSARSGIQPEPPEIDGELLKKSTDERVAQVLADNPTTRYSDALRDEKQREVIREMYEQARAVPPGGKQSFLFKGLGSVKDRENAGELTLRYKVNAGSNNPSAIYKIMIQVNGNPRELNTGLKVMNSVSIGPDVIDEKGEILLEVFSHPSNPYTMTFPPDGLEMLYRVGGYEANFVRVMFAIWIKLGFIAAVAIAAATFLNFPVACLVAVTVLFAAESAGFLRESLEIYVSYDEQTKTTNYFAVVVRAVALPISWALIRFSELKPTSSLVDGRLVAWGSLAGACALIGSWTVMALGIGWAAFRRRELATYSGH